MLTAKADGRIWRKCTLLSNDAEVFVESERFYLFFLPKKTLPQSELQSRKNYTISLICFGKQEV